jgi:hypothetical protein
MGNNTFCELYLVGNNTFYELYLGVFSFYQIYVELFKKDKQDNFVLENSYFSWFVVLYSSLFFAWTYHSWITLWRAFWTG